MASLGAHRVGVEAGAVSQLTWTKLEGAAPEVELVAADGWLEADRAVKEPSELERIAAACAVADRALAALLPEIRVGVTERELALRLEWLIRTGGADGLAFDVACLAGPEAALPHGSPGDRPVLAGEVLLFDFGALVDGYRSDMTRTLFAGEPAARDLALYELVAAAQAAAIDGLADAVRTGGPLPGGRTADGWARAVIEAAGQGDRFGHGTGHGIGLATHELPRLSRTGDDLPLPSPTVLQRRARHLPRRGNRGPDRGPHGDRPRGGTESRCSPASRTGSWSSGELPAERPSAAPPTSGYNRATHPNPNRRSALPAGPQEPTRHDLHR